MAISPKQIGVCSWSLKPSTPQNLVDELGKVGLKTIQLNLMPLINQQEGWGSDTYNVLKAAGVNIVSGMFGQAGENYSTLETIRQTGGVIQDHHWDQNWANARKIAALAASMKLTQVSTHAGFIPDDPNDPNFAKLAGRLKQIADLFNESGIELLFETGQESAAALSGFLDTLASRGTTNIKVNFDPANMILYAKGDPVQALKKLLPRVAQVHIKDATTTTIPGTWGKEVAVGQGDVDWPAFVAVLKESDFQGGLIIEREAGDTRIADVQAAATLMNKLIA